MAPSGPFPSLSRLSRAALTTLPGVTLHGYAANFVAMLTFAAASRSGYCFRNWPSRTSDRPSSLRAVPYESAVSKTFTPAATAASKTRLSSGSFSSSYCQTNWLPQLHVPRPIGDRVSAPFATGVRVSVPVNFDVPGAIERGGVWGLGLGPPSAAASPRRLSSSARVTRDDAGDARAGPGPGGGGRPPRPRRRGRARAAVRARGLVRGRGVRRASEPEPRVGAAPVVARGDDRGRRRERGANWRGAARRRGTRGARRTRGAREARGADAERRRAREAAGANIARGCGDGGRRRPRRARELWRRGRGDGLPDGRLG